MKNDYVAYAYDGHPTPWQVRQFGYERFALLDANQAEIAEFVYERDAQRCAETANAGHVRWWNNRDIASGVFWGIVVASAVYELVILSVK